MEVDAKYQRGLVGRVQELAREFEKALKEDEGAS